MKPSLLAVLALSLPLAVSAAGDKGTQPSGAALNGDGSAASGGVVRRIEFAGLRRISRDALLPHVSTREGQVLDPAQVERDVRALDALGWFDSVTAEVDLLPVLLASLRPDTLPLGRTVLLGVETDANQGQQGPPLRLVFVVQERPFLAAVEFYGSRLLERNQIDALLASRGIELKLARPYNPTDLYRARRAIESVLAEDGYAQSRVAVHLQNLPSDAVRAVFSIDEGPRITVARIFFDGNQAFPDRALRRKMQRIAPHVFLASLRDKDIYTPERLAEDRQRLERYYRNHGFPLARFGEPQVQVVNKSVVQWFPWPRRKTESQFRISIPVEEGTLFRLESIRLEGPGLATQDGLPAELPRFEPMEPYSEEKLFRARDALSHLRPVPDEEGYHLVPEGSKEAAGSPQLEVEVIHQFNAETGTFRATLRAKSSDVYIVRRIEFLGQHRFSDTYYRRRCRLKEGEPYDGAQLQKGLEQLARDGFIQPVSPDDIQIRFDDTQRTADITIRIEEIGRQRISLLGGASPFGGGTLGVAYNVFSLFGGEEWLTGHLEGGPQSLRVLVNLTREGIFGTRASFGLSVFHNVIRPRLPRAAGGQRLFTARSSGFGQSWGYPLTEQDTLSAGYSYARTSTRFPVTVPPEIAGAAPDALRLHTSRSAVDFGWTHEEARQRVAATSSVSGGVLGGEENVLSSAVEYARIQPDPLTHGRNAWAFRARVSGVSSFAGGRLALSQRLFAGEELVRGLRAGELTPYAVTAQTSSSGTTYHAQATGADLLTAANAEYRLPLRPTLQAAAFFDAGAAWLLPQWLGGAAPQVLRETNGALRATTGIELRWVVPDRILGAPMPLAGQVLRVNYALNPLAVVRALLPDGTRWRPTQRRGAFGWGLGSLF